MQVRVLILFLLFIVAGCAAGTRAVPAAPTVLRFPPTWTPAPTGTPAPPLPTATLVIQSSPASTAGNAGNVRRYPDPIFNSIGKWIDTNYLSAELLKSTALQVQIASGPLADAIRRANPRVVTLLRSDLGEIPPGGLELDGSEGKYYEGALLTNVGVGLTSAQFETSTGVLADARAALGARLLIADTYAWSDGISYMNHSSEADRLLHYVDGICLCRFLRDSGSPLSTFKSDGDWQQDVNALSALSGRGNLVVLVATRFGEVSEKDLNLMPQWFDYAFTSFMLGESGPYTYFSFQGPHADDYMASNKMSASLGNPVGGYYPSFGMYARHFQHGIVVVNAGNSEREMPLGQTYTTVTGDRVTRVTLEPYSGQILLHTP